MRVKELSQLIELARLSGLGDDTHVMIEVIDEDGFKDTDHPVACQFVKEYSQGPVKSALVLLWIRNFKALHPSKEK